MPGSGSQGSALTARASGSSSVNAVPFLAQTVPLLPFKSNLCFDPGTEPLQGTFQRAVWVGCARHIRVMMRVLPGQRAGPTLGPSAPRQPCCGRTVPAAMLS